MRKISANYILPVTSAPLKFGIIEVDEYGKITNIIDTKGELKEIAGLEYYNGVLVPGFINTHCHIELSYLKGKIPEKKGITGFVSDVARFRNSFTSEEILKSILKADKLMQHEGIVAVGDITNSNISYTTKLESKLKYHSFIEIFGIDSERATEIFEKGKQLLKEAKNKNLSATISPHSPYSISADLFQLINEHLKLNSGITSIHNQESQDENMLFSQGKGKLADFLGSIKESYKIIDRNDSSLKALLPYLNPDSNILLVHNTFSSKDDIEFAESFSKNIYYTFCPKSNLYIENKLPDISLFCENDLKITIGTDSLASNNSLSILDELKTISKYFPEIEFNDLIKWATINGARALNMDNEVGSFEIGKSPGINLIENVDLKNFQLKNESRIKVLV